MPHLVINTGDISATQEATPRTIIPGVEPGGSRAGRETKPALLIRDCYLELVDGAFLTASDFNQMTFYLKLSQEIDMTPGLQMLIGTIGTAYTQLDGTGNSSSGDVVQNRFRAQGTVWAPRFIGVRVVEVGTINMDVNIHLDYEQINVPWMDWFLMWEFLDGIADNEQEF